MILKGKSLGFTLSEITDILTSQGEASGKMDLKMGLLPEQINAQIDHLERQRNQIHEAIKTLRKAQRHLLELPLRGAGSGRQPKLLLSCRRAQALSVSLISLLRA